MSEVKVSIGRRGNQKGESTFAIEITDRASGLRIVDIEMEPAEFAECIGGLSFCKGEIKRFPPMYAIERYGKKKEVDHVLIDCDKSLPRDTPESFFDKYIPEGWELWSDGLTSQQNAYKKHKITICRYV